MSDKKVAVVIPLWNRADRIPKVLDSVAAQERAPDQVVVVDDGSTDGSAQAVRAWMDAHPGTAAELIRQANHGVGHARNAGLQRACDSHFILFLDSDDELPPNFLANASKILLDDLRVAIATADQRFVYADGKTRHCGLRDLCATPVIWQLREGSGFLSCSLLRTRVVLEVGGFDERLFTGQDTAFFFALFSRGLWRYVPGATVEMSGASQRLHGHCSDYRRRWAFLFDDLLVCKRLAGRRPDKAETKMICSRWAESARDLMCAGRGRDAVYCLAHSVSRGFDIAQIKEALRMAWALVRKTAACMHEAVRRRNPGEVS